MKTFRKTTCLVLVATTLSIIPVVGLAAGTASAGSVAYELYCPGTPVGNIVLNDTRSAGTLTPAAPSQGHRFGISGYTVTLVLPSAVASAAQALGNTSIAGTLKTAFDVTGSRPALKQNHRRTFNVPIPANVPESGLVVVVHFPQMTVGRVQKGTTQITIFQHPQMRLTMTISGSRLRLNCLTYPNNAVPSGITDSAPSGAPVAPMIATGP